MFEQYARYAELTLLHRQYPYQDSKRVLECLQKSLRIANSAIEEIVTVQLYCDALDHYLYYFDHGAPAVRLIYCFHVSQLMTTLG